MPEYFLNRPLTENEQRLRANHRCVGCGVKVKKIRTSKKTGEAHYPFECAECNKSRTRHSSPIDGYDFGPSRASVQHEFIRRIGGNFKDGN